MAEQQEVKIITGDIIYQVIDKIKEEMSRHLKPQVTREDLGKLEILATFKLDKSKMIVGGKVINGKLKRGAKIEVKRDYESVMTGKLTQLQHNKEDVTEVGVGKECGIAFTPDKVYEDKIEVGDVLEIYEEKTNQVAL
jgi:translation initiation factor IF-2